MKISRVATITKVLLDEGLGFLTEPKPEVGPDERPSTAEHLSNAELGKRLRRAFEQLGPTFVKFGQVLATRVDLFSAEVLAELSQLHANATPFPNDVARTILETELGVPLDSVFAELSEDPVAAASIAQVYKARLVGGAEEWVALKVQRPNIEETLLSDLEVLIELSSFMDVLVPPYRRSMVHKVAEEYSLRARQELDFLAEASAIEDFDEVLTTLPEFRAPKVHRNLSTSKVLTMEWIDGVKLGDVATRDGLASRGFDPDRFCRSMLSLQLSMSYEHGFVHGDTHPGNIILQPGGTIGLIDFGLHARVSRAVRDKMLETLFYMASGRTDEAAAAFVTVLAPDPSVNRVALEADLSKVLAAAVGVDAKLGDKPGAGELMEAMRVASHYRLKAPSELFMVVRNLAIVEGLILRLSPDLDLKAELKQITGAILRRKVTGPAMMDEMTQLLPQLVLNISKRPQLLERLLRLERSFVDSKNLGDFLRAQGVIAASKPPASDRWLGIVVAVLVGLLVGFVAHDFVRQ